MPLNARQRVFVAEYLVDKNATRAAIAAGYSEATAGSIGHENLKKPDIRRAIEEGIKKQQRKAAVRAARKGITKERWLEELALIATANMDDYAVIERRQVGQGEDGEKYFVHNVTPVVTKSRPREMGRVIKKLSESKNGIGVELHSKQAALELIGKHFGWVKERVENTGADGGPMVVVTLPSNGREAENQPQQEASTDAHGDSGKDGNDAAPAN